MIEETSTGSLNILFGSLREGGVCRGELKSWKNMVWLLTTLKLIPAGSMPEFSPAGKDWCVQDVLLPKVMSRGLSLPTKGSQGEDGLVRHADLSVLFVQTIWSLPLSGQIECTGACD